MGGWIKFHCELFFYPFSEDLSFHLRSVTQSVWDDGWSKIAFLKLDVGNLPLDVVILCDFFGGRKLMHGNKEINLLNLKVNRGLRTSVGVIVQCHLPYSLVGLICHRETVLNNLG